MRREVSMAKTTATPTSQNGSSTRCPFLAARVRLANHIEPTRIRRSLDTIRCAAQIPESHILSSRKALAVLQADVPNVNRKPFSCEI